MSRTATIIVTIIATIIVTITTATTVAMAVVPIMAVALITDAAPIMDAGTTVTTDNRRHRPPQEKSLAK